MGRPRAEAVSTHPAGGVDVLSVAAEISSSLFLLNTLCFFCCSFFCQCYYSTADKFVDVLESTTDEIMATPKVADGPVSNHLAGVLGVLSVAAENVFFPSSNTPCDLMLFLFWLNSLLSS